MPRIIKVHHHLLILISLICFSVVSVASTCPEYQGLPRVIDNLINEAELKGGWTIPNVTGTKVYKGWADDLKRAKEKKDEPEMRRIEDLQQAYLLEPEICTAFIKRIYEDEEKWFSYAMLDAVSHINGIHVKIKRLSATGTFDTVHEFRGGSVEKILLHTVAGIEGGYHLRAGELEETLNHFNLLSMHRGILVSPTITYSHVHNVMKSKSTSIGVHVSPGSAIPGSASFGHDKKNKQSDTLATISSNIHQVTNSDTSGINQDVKKMTRDGKNTGTHVNIHAPAIPLGNVGELWNQAKANAGIVVDRVLGTPKKEVTQLAVLKKADDEMAEAGVSEKDRSEVFEDQNLTDAIQIAEALKNAQEEKIVRMIREKEGQEKTISQTPDEPHRMDLSEIRNAIQNESFKLTPIEIDQALENLTLVRMSRQDDGGVQFGYHAIPQEDRSTFAHSCLSYLGWAQEKANDLAETNPGAASVIKESIQRGMEAADISGYISAGLAGTTAGMGYGSASLNPLGITVGGIGGMIGGIYAYHQTKNVVGMLFESGTEAAVEAARDQGRTPEESELFGESVASGLFVGALLTGKGKGGKINKTDLTHAANSNRALGVAREKAPFFSTDFAKNARAYIRDMENRSGIPLTDLQKSELNTLLTKNKFEKLDPASYAQHKKEYVKTRAALITEWEQNTGNVWPTSTKLNKRTGKMEEVEHQFHHVIPQEFGGPNQWWNGHPLKGGSAHQGGVHGADSPLNQIVEQFKEPKK